MEEMARPRLWAKPLIATIAVVLVLVLGVGIAAWVGHSSGDPITAQVGVRTAVVQRTSLTATIEMVGSLGYGAPKELGGTGGIVTKVPEVGTEYRAGDVLLEIDGRPVFLLHGDVPVFRDLKAGVTGPDVAALRSALTELGIDAGAEGLAYDTGLSDAVDALYSDRGYSSPSQDAEAKEARQEAKTALVEAKAALRAARKGPGEAALIQAEENVNRARRDVQAAQQAEPGEGLSVEDAQAALRVAQAELADFRVPPDTVAQEAAVTVARKNYRATALTPVGPKCILMVPTTSLRIEEVLVNLGSAAEGTIVTWTDTTIGARVELSDAQRAALATGVKVRLELANGVATDGKVTGITEARTDDVGQRISPGAHIEIPDQTVLAGVGLSAVKVTLVQNTAEQALVVPVTALLALTEGGYAVELVNGTLVGVEVGLVADTRAQITPVAGGVNEGDEVVIP